MIPAPIIIAIDGGGGTGKSSSARGLADKLNFLHVDTGAHYRALTLLLQHDNLPYTTPEAIEHKLLSYHPDTIIEGRNALMTINHKRFSDSDLRLPAVNAEVSYYAALPCVRQFLKSFQQAHAHAALIAGFKGLVMEGRDIGTNIFPDTLFKYFFVVDPTVAANRRAKDGILDVIEQRDKIDSTLGQLHKPSGAKKIDTTHNTLPEVIDYLEKDIRARANF